MRPPFRLSLLLLVAVIACRAEAEPPPLPNATTATTSEPVATTSESARVEETEAGVTVEETSPDDLAAGMSDEELAGGSGDWLEARESTRREIGRAGEILTENRDAIVLLHLHGWDTNDNGDWGEEDWTCTGFVIDQGGTIATSGHCLDGATKGYAIFEDGRRLDIDGIRAFEFGDSKFQTGPPKWDVAVVQVLGFGLPTVSLGNSDEVEVGDEVAVIGFPLQATFDGLGEAIPTPSLSNGIVSSIRILEGAKQIGIDAAVSLGNSGGPVFNDTGEVIGLATWYVVAGQNLNFVFPINYLRSLDTSKIQWRIDSWVTDPTASGSSGAPPEDLTGPPPIPGLEDLGAPPLSMDAETMVGLLLGLPMAYDTPAAKTRYTDPATILEHSDALSLTSTQVDLLGVIARNALATAREAGTRLVATEHAIDAWLRAGGTEQELVDLLSASAVAQSVLRAVHLLARVRGTSILSPEQGLVLDRIMGWESPVPVSRVSIVPN